MIRKLADTNGSFLIYLLINELSYPEGLLVKIYQKILEVVGPVLLYCRWKTAQDEEGQRSV